MAGSAKLSTIAGLGCSEPSKGTPSPRASTNASIANDPDAVLDVHYPSEVANTDRKLPTIIWVHGGGFTSGSKDGVAHYLTILAAKNYTVVGVNYSLAPGKIYPTPIVQVNAALTFLGRMRQDCTLMPRSYSWRAIQPVPRSPRS